MTTEVNDTIERSEINGTGPYTFSFRIFDETELSVSVDTGSLDPVSLTLNTHYTVPASSVNSIDGGSITLTAEAAATYDGDTLDIRSNTIEYQPTSIRNQGSFLPRIHEDAFDRLSRQIQDISRRVDRKWGYPDNVETEGAMDLRSEWADRYAYVNSDGEIEPAAAIALTTLTQSIIAQLLIPQTSMESAAGVTPINYQYAPGDVRRYGDQQDGLTAARVAIQQAIDQSAQPGGAWAYIPKGTSIIDAQLTIISGMKLKGDGIDVSFLKANANTFQVLSDGNSPVSNVEIQDLTIEAVSAGTSNRGIFCDADTSDISETIRIRRVKFKNMFRGVNIHRGSDIEFDDCVGENLTSSLLYVGLSPSAGRSANVRVRRPRVEGGDIVDGSGGANILLAYTDGGRIESTELNDTGASSGSSNLFHGVYLRSCTRVTVQGTKATGHRRGAVVHVYADVGGGEAQSKTITVLDTEADEQQHYAAIRCDQVDGLIVSSLQAREGYTSAAYLTNISQLQLSNVNAKNNARQRVSGTTNPAVRLENIGGAQISNVDGVDDDTGNGQYGQGTLFALGGTNTDMHWCNCRHKFPTGGAIGYYGIEIESGATLTRFSVSGWTQDGCSNVFNEAGTATLGSFSSIDMVNTGSTDLLTLTQLHKFRCRGVTVSGSSWRYESNGQNVTAYLSAAPASGSWVQDDTVWRTSSAASGTFGWRCTVTGSPGTWNSMGNLAP